MAKRGSDLGSDQAGMRTSAVMVSISNLQDPQLVPAPSCFLVFS